MRRSGTLNLVNSSHSGFDLILNIPKMEMVPSFQSNCSILEFVN
jgi:hypothetical protein